MNFQFLFESMPLPFLTLLLPLSGAFLCSALLLYNKFLSRRFGGMVILPRVVYKVPFLLILILNAVFSFLIWSSVTGPSAPMYALTGGGWTQVLSGEAAAGIRSVLRIDAFSAISAALMAFVALAAGISALADKRNVITPRKTAFFLFICAGIQGIFYSGGLIMMLGSMFLTQFGVTGLYSNFARPQRSGSGHLCYYISRIIMLAMFFCGVFILYYKYGTDNIEALAAHIEPSSASCWAFILLVTPLLHLFVKQSPYLPDAACDCFFGIRTQASLFIVFRVVFSIYGPMAGLQKVPALFLMLGLSMIALGFLLSCGVREPVRFTNSMLMYLKGMIICAIGIAMHGVFSAERAALYGVSAMEAMILLWLVFLPISAALSIITVYLKQKSGNTELWRENGLLRRAPFIAFLLLLLVAMLAGLPPFIGYSGRQLLFRSANFISPAVMSLLFLFTMLMLVTGIRFLVSLMAGGHASSEAYHYTGETTVALPLIILLFLFASASLFPGALFESSVSPSVEALVNRTAPAPIFSGLDGGVSR